MFSASSVATGIRVTQNFISQGFRSLPVLLASTVFFLGLVQGNFNFLFFFVGFAILTPTLSLVTNILFEFLFMYFNVPKSLWTVPNPCPLSSASFDSTGAACVVPSFWYPMSIFFFMYVLFNGIDLFNRPAVPNASKVAVTVRQTQTMMSMILVSILIILVTIVRYISGCETALGMIVGLGIGSLTAYLWYSFVRACGLGRISDIFGISNRILPYQTNQDDNPTVCVPMTKTSA